VPEWLQPLIEKQVLYTIAPRDIGWQQKLESFELARWCCAVIAGAAEQFSKALCGADENPAKVTMIGLHASWAGPHFRLLMM